MRTGNNNVYWSHAELLSGAFYGDVWRKCFRLFEVRLRPSVLIWDLLEITVELDTSYLAYISHALNARWGYGPAAVFAGGFAAACSTL